MSGSMAPDPPGREASLGRYLCFGLTIAIGLICSQSSPHNTPGRPRRGVGGVRCPRCKERGRALARGWYICKNRHLFKPVKGNSQE
jgi:hypothetical protein